MSDSAVPAPDARLRFSQVFSIEMQDDDDWFDVNLKIDTRLFVDPFLIEREPAGSWADAHQSLLNHFIRCYQLVAAGAEPGSNSAGILARLLRFPEPREFCLGYTAESTKGSGMSRGFEGFLVEAIRFAVRVGLSEPRHFEEVAIFQEGVGADRISDIVCNVLKREFIGYTQAVCLRHSLPVDTHRVPNAACATDIGRWETLEVELPTNPYNGLPIILVPRRFLNRLPVLGAENWWDSSTNEDLRGQLNARLGREARKADIAQFARQNPERVRAWIASQEAAGALPYDFEADPEGVANWDAVGYAHFEAHPLTSVTEVRDQASLHELVGIVVNEFRHFIEDLGGWRLLWDDAKSKGKSEDAAQLLFLGVVRPYFIQRGVNIDREVEMGRGPVDFKLSNGVAARCLIEIKKLENGKFWNGIERQLPTYMKSDQCSAAWFVVLQYSETKAMLRRKRELPAFVAKVSGDNECDIRQIVVDAQPKTSASKL